MMEKREIAFETGGPKCTISIDNSKVVISIGSDEHSIWGILIITIAVGLYWR
jgi:hypothetical protein